MEGSTASTRSVRVTLAALAAAAVAAATADHTAAAATCSARPAVDAFVIAFNRGDLGAVDDLFAREGEGWVWYFANDRAGQPPRRCRRASRHPCAATSRTGSAGTRRSGCSASTREATATSRSCSGGAPTTCGPSSGSARGGSPAAPASSASGGSAARRRQPTFGPCPRSLLPVARADVPAATAAVLRFVRRVYSELAPSLDVEGARVTGAGPAVGNALGYTARVRCGRACSGGRSSSPSASRACGRGIRPAPPPSTSRARAPAGSSGVSSADRAQAPAAEPSSSSSIAVASSSGLKPNGPTSPWKATRPSRPIR